MDAIAGGKHGLVALALLLGSAMATAQSDDIAQAFQQVSPEEAAQYRAILASPVPARASEAELRQHFNSKQSAARRLSDLAAEETVMRDAVRALPRAGMYKQNLAMRLYERGGATQEANELMRQAIAGADEVQGAFRTANFACKWLDQNNPQEAARLVEDALQRVKTANEKPRETIEQLDLARAQRNALTCQFRLETRAGHVKQALEAATQAEVSARRAQALLQTLTKPQASTEIFVHQEMAGALSTLVQAYRNAGRLADAEQTLKTLISYSRETSLPPRFLSFIYSNAAYLRYAQREFAQAELLSRKADDMLVRIGDPDTSLDRVAAARGLMAALLAQSKWKVALTERQRLEKLVEIAPKLRGQIGNNFDNGVLYLGNQDFARAINSFADAAKFNRATLGDTHIAVAEASGMQGVALWQSGTVANRATALPLLKAAVQAYMLPANSYYLENIGTRKERREDIFATYLDALARTPGENPAQALGAADWVRGGQVQDALNDAAVRSAAQTPALAQRVRREQDLKMEIQALRSLLSEDGGQTLSQSRERIATLERERDQLQAEIKTAMPEYDRLVHPTPPTLEDLARKLDANQALLVLQPTPKAVYVWAVSANRPAAFVRADMGAETVKALVARLRSQLDFAAPEGAGTRFDSGAAYQLYDTLLAPVASAWRGKSQLIVASGGALSQIPFGLLQTSPSAGFDSNAPWLIRESAITQVPSLSAWLAIKALGPNTSASQSFAAWGDPTFRASTGAALGKTSTRNQTTPKGGASLALDLDALALPTASSLRYADIPALPETRDELLAIAKTLKSDPNKDVYLGTRATRDSVLAASRDGSLQNKRVIAFATHGLMAGDLPNLTQPALALAATDNAAQNPLAPLLTLEDVLSLKLNADWVVLSACNTASGDGRGEEALSGLARGFFYAGSRSLLVTHWAVESESAKLLTTNTFAHYAANPQAPKAESLRQAMLKVMAIPKYAHPAFWAPYALVGDSGR